MALPNKPRLMVDVKADLRERLLLVAIKLFAEKGVEAVSMRAINAEAGTKNKSAVHYHFGSKDGILKAISDWVAERVTPATEELWRQIEQREDKDNMSVQELLLVLYTPLMLVQNIPNCGPDIFKLWSKLLIDATQENGISDELFESHLNAVLQRLSKQLPEKNQEHLRFQLIHSVFGFIAGSATLDSKFVEDIKNARIENELEMLFAFIDYASGGISNTSSSQKKINPEFWLSYFAKQAIEFA